MRRPYKPLVDFWGSTIAIVQHLGVYMGVASPLKRLSLGHRA